MGTKTKGAQEPEAGIAGIHSAGCLGRARETYYNYADGCSRWRPVFESVHVSHASR